VSGVSDAELAAVLAALAPAGTKVDPAAAPLTCRVCGEWLDQVHSDVGTHPTCDPEPQPAEEPPSTVHELAGILIDWEATRPRTLQRSIGPSEIAVPCDRRLGYALHSATPTDGGNVKWAPLVGTAVHAVIAEALEAENRRLGRERWLVERRVHPDPMISGSCDAYDVDTDCVIDWKVVGKTSLEQYARHGPGAQYQGQIHIYGRGWQRAGRAPRWVRIVFLPRASHTFDDAYEWTAPYSRRTADEALDRMYRISELLTTLGVDEHPDMWAAVPAAPDRLCNWCPYLRRGGPADHTGCPGDTDGEATQLAKFKEGLIA
jgi:hypothetical protein